MLSTEDIPECHWKSREYIDGARDLRRRPARRFTRQSHSAFPAMAFGITPQMRPRTTCLELVPGKQPEGHQITHSCRSRRFPDIMQVLQRCMTQRKEQMIKNALAVPTFPQTVFSWRGLV